MFSLSDRSKIEIVPNAPKVQSSANNAALQLRHGETISWHGIVLQTRQMDRARMDSKHRFMAEGSDTLNKIMNTLSTPVTLVAGATLFDEGDEGDAVYQLVTGQMEVSVLSEDGRKLVLDVVRPGAMVGEIALFDPGTRTATLTALQASTLRRLSSSELVNKIRQDPELAIDLIRLAGRRMRWMNDQLEQQVFLTLSARLARRILYLTDSANPALKLNQTQLAGFVGATREGVSNILRTWKQNGLIDLTRGGLRVLDRDTLTEEALFDE